MEHVVRSGNQHASMTRFGSGDLKQTKIDLCQTVTVMSKHKPGEAHAMMRESERSRALTKQYKLHEPRNRKVLFGLEDLRSAAIGT